MRSWLRCRHRKTSLPITRPRSDSQEKDSKRQKNIYVVCLSCGEHLPYSFHEGRVIPERRSRARQAEAVSQVSSTA